MTTITSDNQYTCHDLSILKERENHNFAQSKLTLQHIIYHQRKNSLEQAAFWHQVKVKYCLPTPFLHAKMTTLMLLTEDQQRFVLRLSPFPSLSFQLFCPSTQTESLFTGYMLHIPNSTKRKKRDRNIQYV